MQVDKLILGECYFTLWFYKRDSRRPDIKSFIYVGKNLLSGRNESKNDECYFQALESYVEHGSFLQLPERIQKQIFKKKQVFILNSESLDIIYDLHELIIELKKIEEDAIGKAKK